MHDYIVEPVRSILIPGFSVIKGAALKLGALGAGISGSGPSIFALSRDQQTAEQIADKMKSIYSGFDIENETYVSRINQVGPRII
jgi:homoserine kinase